MKGLWSKIGWRVLQIIGALVVIVVLAFIFSPLLIYGWYRQRIYTSVSSVPATDVAIVFGAGVYSNGSPTPILYDRLQTALKLYQQNRVNKIIVSGDNRTLDYNEPLHMSKTLQNWGVPASAIIPDYAGRRTYDTCYRAEYIFKVKSALLISQGYHLPRALFLCNSLGVASTGIFSNQQDYQEAAIYQFREIFALYKSVLDVYWFKPVPVLGDPLPIE